MEKTKTKPTKVKKQIRDKKQQLTDKKQNKIKEQQEINNQKKKKQQTQAKNTKQTDTAEDKEYTLENVELSSSQLQLASKKLMKKDSANGKSKASKPPAKIKVKNKFFADLNIEIDEQTVNEKKEDKNLIEQELSNTNSKNVSITKSSSQFNIEKSKQLPKASNQSKYLSFVKRTDFMRARHDFKRPEQDSKYKSSFKKMLAEVEQAEQVIIKDFSVPQIHRSKLISSSIYVNHQKFKKSQNKNPQIETPKKLTAEQIITERKMLKNRDYFFKKLTQRIKEQRSIKIKEVETQNKASEKLDTELSQNSQNKKVKDSQQLIAPEKMPEKEKTNYETSFKVLTDNSKLIA